MPYGRLFSSSCGALQPSAATVGPSGPTKILFGKFTSGIIFSSFFGIFFWKFLKFCFSIFLNLFLLDFFYFLFFILRSRNTLNILCTDRNQICTSEQMKSTVLNQPTYFQRMCTLLHIETLSDPVLSAPMLLILTLKAASSDRSISNQIHIWCVVKLRHRKIFRS